MYAASNVFLIEEMERGETDVAHFLFAKNEALIGRGIVRLRDTGSGHRGCGCTTHQRKTKSGGTLTFTEAALGGLRFCFEACLTRGMVASSVSSCENAWQACARRTGAQGLPMP